jgi:hypothetical protein
VPDGCRGVLGDAVRGLVRGLGCSLLLGLFRCSLLLLLLLLLWRPGSKHWLELFGGLWHVFSLAFGTFSQTVRLPWARTCKFLYVLCAVPVITYRYSQHRWSERAFAVVHVFESRILDTFCPQTVICCRSAQFGSAAVADRLTEVECRSKGSA